jgi:DNA helicase-2/ATP-dependent DNA helicase PcrA
VIHEIPEQLAVINCADRSFLVTARPGRGKTTIALLYAQRQLREGGLLSSQKVLFLTFSRNGVYQIATSKSKVLDTLVRERLHIATYHSFMWWLLNNFGRYIGLPPVLELIWETKATGVAYGSSCTLNDLPAHLACQCGGITYDCFAPLTLRLLSSPTVRQCLANLFPVIVIDEFQDTDDEQWEFIKLLSEHTRLCCLADPDQMIHRFRGAKDDRLSQFRSEKSAGEYKLQERCLRTDDHEILNFAEAILDGQLGTEGQRSRWRSRFLKDYYGQNAASFWLKSTLISFYKDFEKRGLSRPASIALATYSNQGALTIKSELQKTTGKIARAFSCSVLESESDESIEDLLLHLSSWFLNKTESDLSISSKIIGALLAPKDISKATAPIKTLFSPEKLISGELPLRGTAKHVIDLLKAECGGVESVVQLVEHSSSVLKTMGSRVASFQAKLDRTRFDDRSSSLRELACQCNDGGIESQLLQLRSKVKNHRIQSCVMDCIVPMMGTIATTMHKLKGKEFDYVAILAMSEDTFYSQSDESELDGRRLLYVSLTRARYDARVLYVGTAPPPLLSPYL